MTSGDGDAAPVPAERAIEAGLIACEQCRTVSRFRPGRLVCPRCGAPLVRRRPDSLNRTWALLIAAALLYLPANMLPVMISSTLFGTQNDTILSGVVFFWTSGSPGLALLIFGVSILIPLLKMAVLAYLALAAARPPGGRNCRRCMTLYRIIEFVGRWSMLDVFVVALLVGLVRFQSLARIEAGAGAAAFAGVVVLTMLAVHSFDPRLLWDKDESQR